MSTPEQEPRRWTLRASRRPSNMVDDDWNVVGPGPKMFGLTDNSFQGEQVRVMPVEEGEAWRDRALKAEAELERFREEACRVADGAILKSWADDIRELERLRTVTDEMVERTAEPLRDWAAAIIGGHPDPGTAEQVARAALEAALGDNQ